MCRVVAPCPHLLKCPKVGAAIPCHFPLRVEYPSSLRMLRQEERAGHRAEKFSYLVIARPSVATPGGSPPSMEPGGARIIGPPRQLSRHVEFDVCSRIPGDSATLVVPKSVGKREWEDAKNRQWGDVFPPYFKTHALRTGDAFLPQKSRRSQQKASPGKPQKS